FQKHCIFLNENNMKSHDFNTFRKLRERTTNFASWEKSLKKEGTYPKRDINTNRLQRITEMV
ncbi:hypothetical protein K443DRAFT_44410, partial [Laccaria amethystina LaAM-08-1]